jgi:hypothetical protein
MRRLRGMRIKSVILMSVGSDTFAHMTSDLARGLPLSLRYPCHFRVKCFGSDRVLCIAK